MWILPYEATESHDFWYPLDVNSFTYKSLYELVDPFIILSSHVQYFVRGFLTVFLLMAEVSYKLIPQVSIEPDSILSNQTVRVRTNIWHHLSMDNPSTLLAPLKACRWLSRSWVSLEVHK